MAKRLAPLLLEPDVELLDRRSGRTFKGFEAIAVSHADDVQAAAADDASAWSDPAIVTQQRQSSTTFSDKAAIDGRQRGDRARTSATSTSATSRFKSQQANGPEPIAFSRSTDGGDTFAQAADAEPRAQQLDAGRAPGLRRGAPTATAKVYVVWEDTVKHQRRCSSSRRSTDGGKTFAKPQVVADVTDVGIFDGVRSISFDGIAGARTSSFPSLEHRQRRSERRRGARTRSRSAGPTAPTG